MSGGGAKSSAAAQKTIANLNHVASTKSSSEIAGNLPWSAADDAKMLSLAEKELEKTGYV
jgi:hypothetical protein